MNLNTPKILVVDDDQDLRELLQAYLSQENFTVDCADGGQAMDKKLAKQQYNVIVLDLMMPVEDGLSLLRRLRPANQTPIIILSARGQDIDRITGLELGADDYLAKPFNPRELLARLRALLRRAPSVNTQQQQTIEFGNYLFHTQQLCLYKNDQLIDLTDSESELLAILIKNMNTVLSRDEIIDALRGHDRNPFDRSIDIHITRLRKKIEHNPSKPVYIKTAWGKGYKFHIPDTEPVKLKQAQLTAEDRL